MSTAPELPVPPTDIAAAAHGGLYDPTREHDACGVGFVANIKGRRAHDIVAQGLGGLPAQLNQAIGFQLATNRFDMGLETSKLSFESVPTQYGFGPSFTIRAGAVGRGRTSLSFNYQNVSFGWIDGIGERMEWLSLTVIGRLGILTCCVLFAWSLRMAWTARGRVEEPRDR